MNVKECMCPTPRFVRSSDRLDAAARVLWEQDCGFVPVLDAASGLCGVLTDRDLCMAAYTQGRSLGEIPVSAVMARKVSTCRPDDSVAAALATMQEAQVRRLPVIDALGRLVGVLAMNDLVRLASERPTAFDAALVLRTLAAIGRGRALAKPEEKKVSERTVEVRAAAPLVAAAAPTGVPAAAPAPTKVAAAPSTAAATAATTKPAAAKRSAPKAASSKAGSSRKARKN